MSVAKPSQKVEFEQGQVPSQLSLYCDILRVLG